MTSEPQHQDPSTDRAADHPTYAGSTDTGPAEPGPVGPVSFRRKPSAPTSGVSARSNTAEALDQLRHTTTSATHRINDFMARNTGSRTELERTARLVAERGREETGRGLRALAEAAGKLADLVDGTAGSKGQHADDPRTPEQPEKGQTPEAKPDHEGH